VDLLAWARWNRAGPLAARRRAAAGSCVDQCAARRPSLGLSKSGAAGGKEEGRSGSKGAAGASLAPHVRVRPFSRGRNGEGEEGGRDMDGVAGQKSGVVEGCLELGAGRDGPGWVPEAELVRAGCQEDCRQSGRAGDGQRTRL